MRNLFKPEVSAVQRISKKSFSGVYDTIMLFLLHAEKGG